MKLTVLFFSLLLSGLAVVAQKEIPSFGKIDKADLLMQDCDFDKGAVAVKLIDLGNTYYDRGTTGTSPFKTIFERRIRIKILKEKGLAEADISITYYAFNNDEKITRLSACTFNIDDAGNIKVSPVKKEAIYSKKIDKYYSAKIIAFPEVKVGSVIEYRFTMERETMGQLKDWFFQERIPVRYSEYDLKIPQIFRFSVQPSVIDSMECKQSVAFERLNTGNRLIDTRVLKSTYIMRNLAGIKDEPYMGSAKDYMQRLEFQLSQVDYGNNNIVDLSANWSDVITDLMKNDNFGMQLEKTVTDATELITTANLITGAENTMLFIFNAVRKTVNWNEQEAIFIDNNINQTWQKKTGNSASLNLLLIKLLTDAGLKALPVLFSTRDNGLVNSHYPFLNQFNTVMTFVVIADKSFVLDATDKISNYKLIPEKVVNSPGFIIEGESGRWRNFIAGDYKYKMTVAVRGEIDSTGTMKGNGLVSCSGYARNERCESWLKSKEKFKEDYFTNLHPFLKIENIMVNNIEPDSLPLEQKVQFSTVLNGSGDYRYFTINLFSGFDKNPFTADERIADVDFGFMQEYTLFGNYTIPQDYVFDELPENLSIIMPDTSIIFTRSLLADENLLNVKISVEFKRTYYAATDYPFFAAFYKKLFASLNEPVVIKKKITP